MVYILKSDVSDEMDKWFIDNEVNYYIQGKPYRSVVFVYLDDATMTQFLIIFG